MYWRHAFRSRSIWIMVIHGSWIPLDPIDLLWCLFLNPPIPPSPLQCKVTSFFLSQFFLQIVASRHFLGAVNNYFILFYSGIFTILPFTFYILHFKFTERLALASLSTASPKHSFLYTARARSRPPNSVIPEDKATFNSSILSTCWKPHSKERRIN